MPSPGQWLVLAIGHVVALRRAAAVPITVTLPSSSAAAVPRFGAHSEKLQTAIVW
jgi:hypothetical protein